MEEGITLIQDSVTYEEKQLILNSVCYEDVRAEISENAKEWAEEEMPLMWWDDKDSLGKNFEYFYRDGILPQRVWVEGLIQYALSRDLKKMTNVSELLPAPAGSQQQILYEYNQSVKSCALTFESSASWVVFVNKSGKNPDKRDIPEELQIYNDFYSHYAVKNGSPLVDFVDAIHKIKSFKGDTWYEMFTEATIKEQGDYLYIILDFDHGS